MAERNPQEEWLVSARRELGDLQRSYSELQSRIDDLRYRIYFTERSLREAAPPPQPGPKPEPHPGPRPAQPAPQNMQPVAKPPARPEQRERNVLRTVAVLGSLITVIGVSLAVALAYQSGLLGPAGIAVLGYILAVGLTALGYFAFHRQPATAGVTALYATGFITATIVTFYASNPPLEWFADDLVTEFAVEAIFATFAGIAVWHRIPNLLKIMLVVILPYHWAFLGPPLPTGILTLLAPVTAACLTWFFPIARHPRDAATIRALGALNICVYAIGWTLLTYFVDDPFQHLRALLFVFAAAAFVVGEAFYPCQEQQISSWAKVSYWFCGLIAPLVIVDVSMSIFDGWARWFTPACVAILWAVYECAPARRAPHAVVDPLRAVWMIALALSILDMRQTMQFIADQALIRMLSILAAYAVAFVAVSFMLSRRPRNDGIVFTVWVYGTFVASAGLLAASTGANRRFLEHWTYAVQALIVAAVMGLCLLQRNQIKRFNQPLTVAAALALLPLSMMVVVPLTSYTASILAPQNPEAATTGFYAGHALISITWIALAAWILLSHRDFFGENGDLLVGLILAIAATLKLVLFDLSTLGGIPRVLAFIVSGLLLIAVSVLRARSRATTPMPLPTGPVPPPGIGR